MSDAGPPLDLRDIHAAPDPGWWPPAPGWWLLGLLGLIVLAWLGRLAWRGIQRWQRRRRILADLERLQGLEDGQRFAAEISVFLKRLALARYPRDRVAALHGEDWLAFLDRHGGGGRFRDGPGRVLLHAPYERGGVVDRRALYELARDWVRGNLS